MAAALIALTLLATGCLGPTAQDEAGVPTPASSAISGFVWQTDGQCGYRMLRPEGWEAVESECRLYTPPGSRDQVDRLALRALNYQVLAQQVSGGVIAQFGLFEQDPTLEGWTSGIERMWESNGIEFTLLETLPQAKLYSVSSPGSSDLQITAYIIDDNQPLGMDLTASGSYADLERFREDGIWDDFVAMVSSVQAVPYDPANLTPPLSQSPSLPPALAGTPLPRSMKGYELYSWQADGGWSFTLITGTNRSKTAEEITSDANLVSGDGWVKITVQGVEAIKTVLGRLPARESIFWIGPPGSGPAPAEWDSLALPPEEIVAELQEHCRDLGLELQVSAGPAAAADTENGPSTPAAPVETSGPSEPGSSLPAPTSQPAAAEASPPTQRETPLQLPAGLTVEEYALKNRPQVEPLAFDPVRGSQTGVLAKRALERGAHFPGNSFFAGGRYAMRVKLGEAELVAAEEFDRTGSQGWVTLWQGEKEIYRIDTMPGSPINALRGLWVYDGRWVVETAKITQRQAGDAVSNNVVGQISQDGELLNTRYGYEEMFGFQTMAGRPFYFFKQDGKIGFSYDGQVVHAGYDEIPHYGCCSAGALNPVRATNMIAFFAQREGVWYYVEVGVYAD